MEEEMSCPDTPDTPATLGTPGTVAPPATPGTVAPPATPGTASGDHVGFSYFKLNKQVTKEEQNGSTLDTSSSSVTQRKNLVLTSFLERKDGKDRKEGKDGSFTPPSTSGTDQIGFSYFSVKGGKKKHWEALSFENLSTWMKTTTGNTYIRSGYRPEFQSYSECFKSIFRIHTETGNIWTHLIGSLVFIAITLIFYIKPFCEGCHKDLKFFEKLSFLCFFMGAMVCMGVSSVYHTVQCHSEKVSKYFKKLDYAGIVLLIVGSFVPFIYFAFYCQLGYQVTYLTTISFLGLGTILVTLMDRFGSAEYRKVRAALFVGLGGYGFVPGIHCLTSHGWRESVENFNMDGILLMAFLYIFGAFIYGTRFPERFFPGSCDIWFQSHQIFHTLVLAAALVHYKAVTNTAMFRMSWAGQCSE